MTVDEAPGRSGDWLEVAQPGQGLPRRGQIVEVLGGPRHEHYRVRWTDDYESIHYPVEGTRILEPSSAVMADRGAVRRAPRWGRRTIL
ncbi:DUF1918 domain-containing protein [Candidatus Solirubrobacter pratensis]|uniref:DUF1918 domain-containing protein n=1 Tax=Candidatus Solirubrobacter pratensis TaxID=1298857 RepID=UPI0004883652|nr:DUF1918 domain-containing protein [Candidatus Solirubrobacter pratensis]